MNKRGETLTETIIALTILSIGITIASVVTSTSLRNLESARSKIIAINIAREGIEAVRNIRDSNWLKFSGSRRNCWYFKPQKVANNTDNCSLNSSATDMIAPGNYIVYQDEANRWRLDSTTVTVLGNSEDSTGLSYVDIDSTMDSDGDGDNTNDKDLMNHVLTSDSDALGKDNEVEKTAFSRVITIEYLNDDGTVVSDKAMFNGLFSNPSASIPNRMRVTSQVTWSRGNQNYKVQLKTHLTDYLGRTNINA